ncbi:MAG: DUF4249 domain-containing protein [Schleiferiaceae bacterium]|nr:DUF4249 domain-containing protein [Schleiferiaceae bacterium]
MKILNYILPVLFVASLASCTDIVQIDIPEGEKLIIINGRITDSIPVWVDVLESAPIFEDGDNPRIANATVLLFEDDVQVSTLTQDTAEIYRSSFVGTVGKTYRVEVTVPADHPELGNTTWASVDELLKPTAPIDTIYQDYLQANPPFQDEGIYIFYEFQDPVGVGDRYRIRTWRNDTLFSGGGAIVAFDDEFFDGYTFTNDVTVPLRLPAIQANGQPAKVGQPWKIEHSSLSNDYQNYLLLVQQQTSQTGGLFDPPPALLEGNIKGITSPERTALGYFAASGIYTVEYTVQ